MTDYVVQHNHLRKSIGTEPKHCLNIGCGFDLRQSTGEEHWINCDFDERYSPDVLMDAECLPWPFPDDFFNEIRAYHIIEHVADPDLFMKEIWRISAHNAKITLAFPHNSRVWATGMPKHKSAINTHIAQRFPNLFIEKSIRFEWLRIEDYPEGVSGRLTTTKSKWYTRLLNKWLTFWFNLLPLPLIDRWLWVLGGGIDHTVVTLHVNKATQWEDSKGRAAPSLVGVR